MRDIKDERHIENGTDNDTQSSDDDESQEDVEIWYFKMGVSIDYPYLRRGKWGITGGPPNRFGFEKAILSVALSQRLKIICELYIQMSVNEVMAHHGKKPWNWN